MEDGSLLAEYSISFSHWKIIKNIFPEAEIKLETIISYTGITRDADLSTTVVLNIFNIKPTQDKLTRLEKYIDEIAEVDYILYEDYKVEISISYNHSYLDIKWKNYFE